MKCSNKLELFAINLNNRNRVQYSLVNSLLKKQSTMYVNYYIK